MTTDPEILAVETIATALAPLDRAACSRVLDWAEKRYTQLHVEASDLEAFSRFTDALAEAAREIGEVTPLEIMRFAENVQKYERDRIGGGAA